MIFGSKKHFAIESEIFMPVSQYPCGRICFWANDKKIGVYEQPVLLFSIADYLSSTLAYQGQRQDETLVNILPEQALNLIFPSLYVKEYYKTKSFQELRQRTKKYEKFCICPNGSPAFDGEIAVLVENPTGDLFIWQDFHDKNTYQIQLQKGEYEMRVREFLDWINTTAKP